MAKPTLSPASTTSAVVLTSTGSIVTSGKGAGNTAHYPFGLYADTDSDLYDVNFVNGASDQVAFTFKKLGGDVLDIELSTGNIYAAYEEAVLEYSYQINIHQAKNVLSDLLGMSTGTFDHDGQMNGGDASDSAVNLSFPRFEFGYAERVADGISVAAGGGGNKTVFSASFATTASIQDYDLQSIIASKADNPDVDFAGLVGNKKIKIEKVFYKTPQSMWLSLIHI